jgi:hypothetical protein
MTRCARGTQKNKSGECVKKHSGFTSIKNEALGKKATAKKTRKTRKCKHGPREFGKCPKKSKTPKSYHQPDGPIYNNSAFNGRLRKKSFSRNSIYNEPKETWEL